MTARLTRWKTIRSLLALSAMIAIVTTARAAAPRVSSVNIRGLQIGGTTTIAVSGTDLVPNPRLSMFVPIARQTLRPNATATRVEFDVTLDRQVEPGIYNLWLSSAGGISQPVVVAADHLPQQPFAAEVTAFPVALHGEVFASSKLRTSFHGKAGQTIVFEVEAQRLGGKLRPVLHLYDRNNKHLAWSMPEPGLRGDTRLETTLSADGTYTLELHDLQYAAPAPNHFRLKIGSWQYADLVFPPAVRRNKEGALQLLGNVPDRKQVTFIHTGNRLAIAAPWLDAAASSGLRPTVIVSDFPESLEVAPPDGELQALPSVPGAISGRLTAPGEQDGFRLTVEPGDKLRFEVFADRVGAPMDSVLELQNEQGARLAINDDTAGSADSLIDYTVPANVTTLIANVRDANGGGGDRCIYRIAVTPLERTPDDFQLSLEEQHHSIAAGDRKVARVAAVRNGYGGPIRIAFDDLPAGVQVQGGVIPSGTNATLLTLHGAGNDIAHVLTTVRGIGTTDSGPIIRYASDANHPLNRMQPWLGSEVAVALGQPTGIDFVADWGRLASDSRLVLGGTFSAPIQCRRPVGFDGPVRLTLLSSQIAPLTRGRPDPNHTIRIETSELAADANAQKMYDVQTSAAKVLAEAQKHQTAVAQAGAKTRAGASEKVRTAQSLFTATTQAATVASSQSKEAEDANVNAADVVASVVAQLRTRLAETETSSGDTIVALAKATAEAAAGLQNAAEKKTDAHKAAVEAATKLRRATDAMTAAGKALERAQADLKAATNVATSADAAEAAKINAATDKLQAAKTAAETAARLAKNDGQFKLLVPADLARGGYEIAWRAELLSRDKKTVVATSDTGVRRISTLNPILLSLNGPQRVEGVIDPKTGATVTLSGRLERLAGMDQDITVTLAGLPMGIAVPSAVVNTDQTDFELQIKFPANFTPAEVQGVKLFATGKMNPKAPLPVRSEDVAVEINLKPVGKE